MRTIKSSSALGGRTNLVSQAVLFFVLKAPFRLAVHYNDATPLLLSPRT